MTAPRFRASDRSVHVHVRDEPRTGVPTTRSRRVGHLVRGESHTLCGHRADRFAWIDPDETTTRCAECFAVPEGHFISRDLLALGLTYRQVDWWTRRGLLLPDGEANPGSGYQRTFPPAEYEAARLMAPLVAAGIPPKLARQAALTGELAPGITIAVAS